MSDRTCEQIEEVLVDYADNELAGEERGLVEGHLAGCEHCRTLLEALRRSATLTGEVWDEAHSDVADLRPGDIVPHRRRVVLGGVGIAAAILVALLAALAGRVLVAPRPQPAPAPVVRPEPLMAAVAPLRPEQVRRSVDAAGASVALLASVDWLAEQPGNLDVARQQYEFITHMYAGSEVGKQAQSRLAALEQRRS